MKNRKVVYLIEVIVIVLLIIVTILGQGIWTEAKKDGTVKIGFSMDSLVVERWQYDKDFFVSACKRLGANVIVKTGNNDTELQIEQIRELINLDIDVLVIVPHDFSSLVSVINQAKKKGIKVIAYDRLIMDASIDMYISFDNEKVGRLMGEYLYNLVPKGNYVLINGAKEDNNAILYQKGVMSIIGEAVAKGDIQIIDEIWCNDWREDYSYKAIDTLLTEGQQIDAIMCANDRLAEAAIQALAERRLVGNIPIVGHDASIAGCKRIIEGSQGATVYKPLKTLAETAADYAVQLAKGEKITASQKMDNGKVTVPYHQEDVYLVDKKGIEDIIIKQKVYKSSEIYGPLGE